MAVRRNKLWCKFLSVWFFWIPHKLIDLHFNNNSGQFTGPINKPPRRFPWSLNTCRFSQTFFWASFIATFNYGHIRNVSNCHSSLTENGKTAASVSAVCQCTNSIYLVGVLSPLKRKFKVTRLEIWTYIFLSKEVSWKLTDKQCTRLHTNSAGPQPQHLWHNTTCGSGGTWPPAKEEMISKYLKVFTRFVKLIDFQKLN